MIRGATPQFEVRPTGTFKLGAAALDAGMLPATAGSCLRPDADAGAAASATRAGGGGDATGAGDPLATAAASSGADAEEEAAEDAADILLPASVRQLLEMPQRVVDALFRRQDAPARVEPPGISDLALCIAQRSSAVPEPVARGAAAAAAPRGAGTAAATPPAAAARLSVAYMTDLFAAPLELWCVCNTPSPSALLPWWQGFSAQGDPLPGHAVALQELLVQPGRLVSELGIILVCHQRYILDRIAASWPLLQAPLEDDEEEGDEDEEEGGGAACLPSPHAQAQAPMLQAWVSESPMVTVGSPQVASAASPSAQSPFRSERQGGSEVAARPHAGTPSSSRRLLPVPQGLFKSQHALLVLAAPAAFSWYTGAVECAHVGRAWAAPPDRAGSGARLSQRWQAAMCPYDVPGAARPVIAPWSAGSASEGPAAATEKAASTEGRRDGAPGTMLSLRPTHPALLPGVAFDAAGGTPPPPVCQRWAIDLARVSALAYGALAQSALASRGMQAVSRGEDPDAPDDADSDWDSGDDSAPLPVASPQRASAGSAAAAARAPAPPVFASPTAATGRGLASTSHKMPLEHALLWWARNGGNGGSSSSSGRGGPADRSRSLSHSASGGAALAVAAAAAETASSRIVGPRKSLGLAAAPQAASEAPPTADGGAGQDTPASPAPPPQPFGWVSGAPAVGSPAGGGGGGGRGSIHSYGGFVAAHARRGSVSLAPLGGPGSAPTTPPQHRDRGSRSGSSAQRKASRASTGGGGGGGGGGSGTTPRLPRGRAGLDLAALITRTMELTLQHLRRLLADRLVELLVGGVHPLSLALQRILALTQVRGRAASVPAPLLACASPSSSPSPSPPVAVVVRPVYAPPAGRGAARGCCAAQGGPRRVDAARTQGGAGAARRVGRRAQRLGHDGHVSERLGGGG